MALLPHAALEGARFPAVAGTQAAALLAVQQQLAQTQYWPAEALRAAQFAQIDALLAHIDRFVPHYGISLRRAGVKAGEPITAEAWARVPILTRRAVQEAGDRLHAREVPRSHGELSAFTTSGTSGMPVRVLTTKLHHFYWQSFQLRDELWRRRDLSRKILGIRRDEARIDFSPGAHVRRLPDWGPPVSVVYPTGPAVMLDYRSTVAEQVEVIRAERPGYLVAYPSLLLELLRHCRAHGVGFPGLLGVQTVREALAPETHALCREVLGLDITDTYSCAEAGTLAVQCPEHGAYHLQQESALIEVLRDDGGACSPGEIGRVVITPLHNFAMPLVRYELGDLAEMGEPCACGRTLPVIARIVGRARDMLALPGGGRRYPYYGHNAMMAIDAIRQHQVAQTSLEDIEIRLVVARPLTAAEEDEIRQAAHEGLGGPFRPIATRSDAARTASTPSSAPSSPVRRTRPPVCRRSCAASGPRGRSRRSASPRSSVPARPFGTRTPCLPER
jgi:phenylacetate-CoA ligase